METLKGFARRTTQSLREMVSGSETSPEQLKLTEFLNKVKTMEAKGEVICEKVIQAARLMEELGTTLKDLGEEYKSVPDLPKESRELAEDVFIVGVKLVETSQEHQRGLKDNVFELLRAFSKQYAQLREVEETRRHHQLEYDFFKSKVQDLRAVPQKDFTRVPRNEQILESWRVELWRVTERSKALCSQLYVDGRRAVDRSVLTTVQVLHSFVEIASTGFAQTFQSVQLPSYTLEPVLPPSPLPAAPMPSPTYGNYNSANSGGGAGGLPSSVPQNYGYSANVSNSSSDVYASAPPAWVGALAPAAPSSPAASTGSAHAPNSPPAHTSGSSQPATDGATSGYQPPPLHSSSVQDSTPNAYQPPNV